MYTKIPKMPWYKSIFARTALLSWGITIVTLSLYLIFIIPFQKEAAVERMDSQAEGIASSIGQVTTNAIILEDYGFAVEHCNAVLAESNSLLYVVITKKDGFSLIHTKENWKLDTLRNFWTPDDVSGGFGNFLFSDLVNEDVYHFSQPFNYSGIDWGWIHIGLNLRSFNSQIDDIIQRSIFLAMFSLFIGFVISIVFAKKLSNPIRDLDSTAKKIAEGDLDVHVNIASGNELESLSHSFNIMATNLSAARSELEQRVQERTKELAEANDALHTEIGTRIEAERTLYNNNMRLEALRDVYKGIISVKSAKEIIEETLTKISKVFKFTQAGVALFDHENNKAFLIATNKERDYLFDFTDGYTLDSFSSVERFKEKDFYFEHYLEEKKDMSQVESLILNEHDVKSYLCIALKFRDKILGEIYIGSNTANSFSEQQLEILREIADPLAVAIEQINLKDSLENHAADLQVSLAEKEVLLKEIHHRVKNNMQIISSLLYLQSKNIEEEKALSVFRDSQNRIKTMALVHEKLYQSEDFSEIDFGEYIKNLVKYIFQTYAYKAENIRVDYNFDTVLLNIDSAVPCGLIINELISNALKYAFSDYERTADAENKILIEIKKLKNNSNRITVADNGKGIPDNFSLENAKSLGLKLVNNLVNQLDGDLKFINTQGTSIQFTFKENNNGRLNGIK